MFSQKIFSRTLLLSGALLLWQGTAEAAAPGAGNVPAVPPPVQRPFEPTAPSRPFEARPAPSDPGDFANLATKNKAHWRLVELQGRPAERYEHQAEPQLMFMPESATQGRIGGADGCNRLLGTYTVGEGDSIAFNHLGSTRMLCPQGDAQARLMQETLGKVTVWRITGDTLELWDAHTRLAVFTAAPSEQETPPAR